jgi:hypothetical protein
MDVLELNKGMTGGLAAVLLAGCLSLPAIAETQRVEGLSVDRVIVKGSVEVEINQDDDEALLIKGSEKQLAKKPFYVDDGTLVLGASREDRKADFHGVKYKLSLSELEHLQLKGSGEVYVRPLESDKFYASVEGSGDIKLFDVQADRATLQVSGSGDIQVADLVAPEVRLVLSGSGDIHLQKLKAEETDASVNGSGDMSLQGEGATHLLELNIVGSGDIDFRDLNAHSIEVNIVGSGSARVGASEELDVTIMGSGDVVYGGRPDIDQSIMGSGSVTSAD